MMDEIEEWNLLAAHYCVLWVCRDGNNASTWAGWEQLETQLRSKLFGDFVDGVGTYSSV